MARKKKQYVALKPCRSDETGAAFAPGDIVTGDDFPAAVIKNWLAIDPPVLSDDAAVIDATLSTDEEE